VRRASGGGEKVRTSAGFTMNLIDDEACEWVLTLDAPPPAGRASRILQDRMLRAWLARSPAHARALLELQHAYFSLQDYDKGALRVKPVSVGRRRSFKSDLKC